MANCKVCGSPKKDIPAGISKKTGKPYSAFQACPNRCVEPRYDNNEPRGWSKPVEVNPDFVDVLTTINAKVDKIIEILSREMPEDEFPN